MIACLTPAPVQPGMRRLFGNVVVWTDGFSAAQGVHATDLAPPGLGQVALLTSWAGDHHLVCPPPGGHR